MNQQFECTKIKDGLYIGNIVVAHDYQFLISNKFNYIINCTAQIPNVFESQQQIHYLKFKLIANKPHKLWDETLKKLIKLQKFLQQAQQNSLCVLIHSFHGQNRSLVLVIAYLMKKYKWNLTKCLQYLKAKQVFIGLSGHYITQLEILEDILKNKFMYNLTNKWIGQYQNQQEQIISKTYLNSLFIKVQQNQLIKQQKKKKRIVWLDKLQTKKRKQKEKQYHQIMLSKKQKQSNKNIKYKQQLQQNQLKQSSLKIKQATSTHLLNVNNNNYHEDKKDKNIYQLTINNFISPKFNMINNNKQVQTGKSKKNKNYQEKQDKSYKTQKEKVTKPQKQKDKIQNNKSEKQIKKRPTSANSKHKKNDKMNRAKSQKQVQTYQSAKQKQKQKQKRAKLAFSVETQKKDSIITIERQIKKEKEKKDIKKQLKKQIQKVEKQKSSHSVNSLHMLYMTKPVAKRNSGSTPTKKQKSTKQHK